LHGLARISANSSVAVVYPAVLPYDAYMPDRDAARGRAQGYVDAAQRFAFPAAEQIATAPKDPERALLLYCPEQGGWHVGEWYQGEWTDTLTRGKSLKPPHWMNIPPEPVEA
jgi:hypothetical protein